jgi:DNA adenine methylase
MREFSDACNAKPFIKWAGGKSQILSKIKTKYPKDLGKRINKYAEPFVGGGAVLFDILNNYSINEVYISDINRELVYTYTSIRDNINNLIELLKMLEVEYLPAETEERKSLYYKNRERFNELKMKDDASLELAALFIFLNRTCFNGLYRVNAKGYYNVPQGSYKNPSICDEENLRAVSSKLTNVTIINGDYKLAQDFIDDKTFCYFDPPYRPLTTTASFTSYAQDGFDDSEQMELAKFIDNMSERGASVVASNSDPKNVDETDNFFDVLYAKHNVFRIDASRAINSVGSGRGKVKELLIANL